MLSILYVMNTNALVVPMKKIEDVTIASFSPLPVVP